VSAVGALGILDALRAKALDETQAHAAGWLDAGIERARSLLPRQGTEGDAGSYRFLGMEALNKIERHKADLAALGPAGLTAALSYLSIGALEQATLIFLREKAGWTDLFSASQLLEQKDAQAARDRMAARAKALSILGDIGMGAARAALPLLLMVL
jgi:hypothetical protein